MKRFSYKSLFIILFLLLIGIVVLWKYVIPKQQVKAAWWNDGWNYRKAVSITNNAGSTLNNQRVKIVIDTSTLIATGKLQSDCDDIRITDINGNLLDHWDTGCNTVSTNVYFKVSSLISSPTAFYVYYGNSSADNIEKILGTFDDPGTSCKMMKDQGSVTASGLYYVSPGGNDSDKIQVYCNTDIIGDAWTLVINNGAYTIPPKPTWVNAVNEVNITGSISNNLDSFDLLLGLKHWNHLGNSALIQMGSGPSDITKRAYYSSFSLDTSNNYALSLSGQVIDLGGTAPGFYSSHRGYQFTTYDSDHDTNSGNCSTYYSNTPWWYSSCWSGNIWGGGDVGGYQNKPYWVSATTDYYNYGGIYIGGADSMQNVLMDVIQTEEAGGGLIAYWKFDEGVGTTAYDSSTNQNNGTISGATWQTEDQCISGKCLNFNGINSYINNPNPINTLNGMTIQFWFKKPNTNAGAQYLLDGRNGGNWWFLQDYTSGVCTDSSGNICFNGLVEIPSAYLSNNTWYNVALTANSSSTKIYLNGRLINTGTAFTPSIGANLRVGTRYTTESFFNGYMDDVKIYSYARTPDQIKLDYNSRGSSSAQGSGVNMGINKNNSSLSDGLVGYWNFEEGSGSSIRDTSGNNYGGSIYNTEFVSGKYGKALKFLGDVSSYANIDYQAVNNLYDFTISFWMKSDGSGDGIISGAGPITDNELFIAYQDNFTIRSKNVAINTGISANDNQWHFISSTRDHLTGSMKLYLDGILKSQGISGTGPLTISPGAFIIGQDQDSVGGGFQSSQSYGGLIDELKIYNYTRSQKQIIEDMNSGASATSSKSMAAYYKFDEGSYVTANNSGNLGIVSNGILQNGPSWVSEGKVNKGLRLDGLNDYVEVANNNSLKYRGEDLTLSFWFKPDPSDDGGWIISKPWNGSGQYNYYISSTGGSNPSLRINLSGLTGYSFYFSKTIPSNQWSHIAATINGLNSQIKLYINGIFINSEIHTISNWTPSAGDGNLPLALGTLYPYGGSWSGIASHAVKGFIDEVKIYNYVLTDEEIKQDYNQGSAFSFGSSNQTIGNTTTSLEYCIPGDNTSCLSPIGEWLFEENSGLTTKDTSGSSNSASFGSTSYSPAWVSGKNNEGAALHFDGVDDRATLASTINLVDSNNWTVSAWVKTNSGGTILSNSSGGPVANDLKIANNKISYAHYSGAWLNEYGNTNVSDGKWHHLTWVNHSNKTMDMYVDGIGDTYGVNSAQSSGPVNQIGRNWATTFSGTIDQVKIYNYARTPAQIAYDYNKGEPIAWFKFDECQGNIVNNSSSIGITGSINIGSSGSQNTLGTCAVGSSAAWTNGSAGKINGSLNFDGVDDYVFFGDPANGSLDFGINDFTLSAWIKSSVPQTSVILGKYYTYPLYYMRLTASGVLESRIGFDSSTNYSNTGISSVVDGKWHHVVSVFQRNGSIVNYLDGLPHGSPVNISASSTRTVSTTNSFTIGSSLSTQFFKGQIDDARVYNYALTSEQIKLIYNNGAINFN